jgi:hypothetical protein
MSDPDSASAMTYDNLDQTLTVDNANRKAGQTGKRVRMICRNSYYQVSAPGRRPSNG